MQDNVTQGWVDMGCPICGAAKGERCKDSMGHNHPASHSQRFVHSAHLASTTAQTEAVQKLVDALGESREALFQFKAHNAWRMTARENDVVSNAISNADAALAAHRESQP
tara:strand:- start:188 stop:517 length:330 start_codon:yes stop_codon:yes gene_type:complete